MSDLNIMNKSQLFAAAAAIGAGGFLATPAAHADTSCTVNGEYLRLQQHEGNYTTTTSVNANGSALGPGVVTVPPSGTNGTYGTASGSINGRAINVHITWSDNKGTADFTGTVGNDGIAHGTSTGTPIPINLWNPGPWDTAAGALNCPAGESPQTQGAKTATVTNDVDLYNKKNEPDGAGQVVGMLNSGTQVQLVGSCEPSSWCQVGGPNVPGGNGWVWGNLQL